MRTSRVLSFVLGVAAAFGADCSSQENSPQPAAKAPKNEIVLDRTCPVTPLGLELQPGENLVIKIRGKSPWEKISFDAKVSEVDDETKKQTESLFKFLTKAFLSVPMPTRRLAIQEITIMSAPDRALRNQMLALRVIDKSDALKPFAELEEEQERLAKLLDARQKELNGLADQVRVFVTGKPDQAKFVAELDDKTKRIKKYQKKDPISLVGIRETLEELKAYVRSGAFGQLKEDPQARIRMKMRELVTAQAEFDQVAAEMADTESGLTAAAKAMAWVKNEGDKVWFEVSRTYTQPANRKLEVDIVAVDMRKASAEKDKLVTISATWKRVPLISTSVGFAVSMLGRKDWGLNPLRNPSKVLGTDGDFSYTVGASETRPITLPMGLVHVRLPIGKSRDYGVAATGGFGVDLSGSSPTGEMAAGGSFRFRSLYLSPMIHWGRRKELTNGVNSGDAAQKGFVVPTRDVWGRGFVFAITYRLPL